MKTQVILVLAVVAITMFACTEAFRTKMKAQNLLQTQTGQGQCYSSYPDASTSLPSCNTFIATTNTSTLDTIKFICNPTIYNSCNIASCAYPLDEVCFDHCGNSDKNSCDNVFACCCEYWNEINGSYADLTGFIADYQCPT